MKRPLSVTQKALFSALPFAPSDGKRCKGQKLRTARSLERRGLAREVGAGRFVKAFEANVATCGYRIVEP